jgi:hypothetical protein
MFHICSLFAEFQATWVEGSVVHPAGFHTILPELKGIPCNTIHQPIGGHFTLSQGYNGIANKLLLGMVYFWVSQYTYLYSFSAWS